MFSNGYKLRKSISFWAIAILVVVSAWYGKNLKRWEKNEIINNDVTHYYAYLPATFIYNDWKFDFVKNLPHDFEGRIWLLQTPDGKPVLKMTMGLSILWLPFEGTAHMYAKLSSYKADGYSKPYSVAIFAAALFYLFLGLFYLRKLLLRFFDEISTAITLLLLVFGTNLMHYVIVEPGMSHVYNFFLITVFVYFSTKWIDNPGWALSLLVGAVAGLIILIRPINIVVGIVPLLWNVLSWHDFTNRLKLFLTEWEKLAVAIVVVFLFLFPQLLYWKIATGEWVYYSYQEERFFFGHPHIIDGLFSFRKGWFVYTPIMAIAFFGFISLYKKQRGTVMALAFTMVLSVYAVFSWWCWWYGGSYGSRPMIDFYGVMAIPLAALVFHVRQSKLWAKLALAGVLGFLVYFNQIQMTQYRTSLLHWDSMTKEVYTKILFKKNWPPDYDKMIKTPDYVKAKKGEDEY